MGTGWRWLYLNALGFSLLISGAFIFWVIIPKKVVEEIAKQQALVNGSEAWERWVNTPLPLDFKVYIFNVTNPDQVTLGEKPRVEEIGPFVYKEYKYKTDVRKNPKRDTIFYRQRTRFEFDEAGTLPLSQDDVVTVLNPALIGLVETVSRIPYLRNISMPRLDRVIPDMYGDPKSVFITLPVRALLFEGLLIKCNHSASVFMGDVLLVCSGTRSMMPMRAITETKDHNFIISLFGYKNNSDEGVMEVHSGVTRPDLMGTLVSWNGREKTSAWPEPCNQVTGADITLPPSRPAHHKQILIFSTDVCSAVGLEYTEDITFAGIKGFRFSPVDSFMEAVDRYPENKCHCPGPMKKLTMPLECMEKGVLDISSCLDAPIILSRPHFYKTSRVYSRTIEGLKPDPQKHDTYMDLEQYTGTPLRGYRRFQINMFLRKNEHVRILNKVPTALVPIVWLDEGCELTEKEIDLVNSLLYNILRIIAAVKWLWMTVGVLLVLAGPAMFVYKRLKEQNENAQTKDDAELSEKLRCEKSENKVQTTK
ncbi:unnamed protein product [Bemisia tabaci]|uniref:Sensory neuron membrane protein 2 n=1 Tax=Bemisia tabaci TaxID=7038 RepID=A0A9P0AEA0_BEMTA|nr:unnamed protein product [Bemisia tabaci]